MDCVASVDYLCVMVWVWCVQQQRAFWTSVGEFYDFVAVLLASTGLFDLKLCCLAWPSPAFLVRNPLAALHANASPRLASSFDDFQTGHVYT